MILKRLFKKRNTLWICVFLLIGAIIFTMYYSYAFVNSVSKKQKTLTRTYLMKSRIQNIPLLNVLLRNATLADTFENENLNSTTKPLLTTTPPVSSKGTTISDVNQTKLFDVIEKLSFLKLSPNENVLNGKSKTNRNHDNWLPKLQRETPVPFSSTSTSPPPNIFESKNNERKDFSVSNDFADLTLHIRMTASKQDLYETILVTSMRYFWIYENPIVVVLDSTKADVDYGKKIQMKYPYPKICHERKYEVPNSRKDGHKLQQMKLFLIDECVDNKYVGFVDTDTLLATIVTADLLFEDGKPIIIAQYGKWADNFWRRVSESTKFLLGEAEVFKCMTYFPIIFQVKHIVEFRHFLEKKHKMDIISLFKTMLDMEYFSEYNLMCNYLWYFHRDEYKFHAQLRVENGIWHGEENPEGRVGLEYYHQHITQEISYPMPRSGIHYRHVVKYTERKTYLHFLKAGLCFSGGFDYCSEKCQAFNKSSLHRELYNFEWSNWTWDSRCIDAQRKHYGILDRSRSPQIRKRIKLGCEEIDNLPFNLKPSPYQ